MDVKKDISDASVGVHVKSVFGDTIMMIAPDENYKAIALKEGKYQFKVILNDVLMPGEYSFDLSISQYSTGSDIDFLESVGKIQVHKDSLDHKLDYPWATVHGYFKPTADWEIKKI